MAETAINETENARCRVCLTPNTSLHLDIEACRACAIFFKRLAVSGRRYPCRTGLAKCQATEENRLACRRCRFERCLAVGMKYEGLMRNMNKQLLAAEEDFEVLPAISHSPSTPTLLDRIGEEYEACGERRRVKEHRLIKEHNLVRLPHPTEEVYLATFECSLACFTESIPDFWQLLRAIFPALEKAPQQDQSAFYRHCMRPFVLPDQFCRTMKIWGGFERYSMSTMMLCCDKERPEVWARQNEPALNREDMIDCIRLYGQDLEALIVPSLEKANLCDKETHALLVLLLCESAHGDIPDSLLSMVEEVRSEILRDLHRLYTNEMQIPDYSTRIGSLFNLCHLFQEGSKLMQDTARMQVAIFNFKVAETMLADLLLS